MEQVAQAVVHLRPRPHESQRPEVGVDRPQLKGGRVLELPVARGPHIRRPVAFARHVLVHERGRGAEQMAAAAAVVDRLVEHHPSPPVAKGADFERTRSAIVQRAGRAQQHTPGLGAAVEVQQRGRGHDDVRAAQAHMSEPAGPGSGQSHRVGGSGRGAGGRPGGSDDRIARPGRSAAPTRQPDRENDRDSRHDASPCSGSDTVRAHRDAVILSQHAEVTRHGAVAGAKSSRGYAANRCALRALRRAASTSRSFGGAVVTSSPSSLRRDLGHFLDGALERGRVRLRGLGEAADLAHILHRRRAHLVLARGGLEVVERSDVSAHAPKVAPPRRGGKGVARDRTRRVWAWFPAAHAPPGR